MSKLVANQRCTALNEKDGQELVCGELYTSHPTRVVVAHKPTTLNEIILLLRNHGEVVIRDLSHSVLPTQHKALDIQLFPGVFPRQVLCSQSMQVYPDKNLLQVFSAIMRTSGWPIDKEEEVIEKQTIFKQLQIVGPPGCGKSVGQYVAGLYASTVLKKLIVYVPIQSAECMSSATLAVFWDSKCVVMLSETAEDRQRALIRLVKAMQRVDAVFFDGYNQESASFIRHCCEVFHSESQGSIVGSIIATSSMATKDTNQCLSVYASTLTCESWGMEDYQQLLETVELDHIRLANLGLEVGASREAISAAVRAKFALAGHSCRFMLDRHSEMVNRALHSACVSATNRYYQSASETSDRAVNTLVVNRNGRVVPVSAVAGLMISKYHLVVSKNHLVKSRVSTKHQSIEEALKANYRPMLGWLFEGEVLDRLKKYLMSGSEAMMWSFANSIEGLKYDVCGPFQLTWRGSGADTTAMNEHIQSLHNPDSSIAAFEDRVELVTLVKTKLEGGWRHPLWLIPKSYNNPFFDAAQVSKEGNSLVFRTLQITIAKTHSCNALIMQLLANDLPGMIARVYHFAVVHSVAIAEKFKFNAGENLGEQGMLTRLKAMQLKAFETAGENAGTAKKRRRSKSTAGVLVEELYNDDGSKKEEEVVVEATLNISVSVVVDVIGGAFVLEESLCGLLDEAQCSKNRML